MADQGPVHESSSGRAGAARVLHLLSARLAPGWLAIGWGLGGGCLLRRLGLPDYRSADARVH